MKLVSFRDSVGTVDFGILREQDVMPLPPILRAIKLPIQTPQFLIEFLTEFDIWHPLIEDFLKHNSSTVNTWALPLETVTLEAPIPNAQRDIICLGLNYRDHIEQNSRATGLPYQIPEVAMFFGKPAASIIGPGAAIEWDPEITQKLDYEIELALVIGKQGKNIPVDRAWEHILGYTIVNDISARDVQLRVSQFYQGKGMDTYCPVGPYIVTKDEIPSPENIELTLRVNGQVRQHTRLSEMIFDIPHIISAASCGMTLQPGDIITTATPGGCAYAQENPVFLKDGDVVECEATGLGTLSNPVVRVN